MSALDMSLEDVIKSKGGNSKRPVRSTKAASNGTKKVQNTERPKRNTAGVASGALVKSALKAAAAAAVAASKPAPAVTAAAKAKGGKEAKEGEAEKSEKPAATKPVVQAITPGKAPKGGTEDKLGMTLEDVIRNQDQKKVAEPRDVKRPGALAAGRGGFRQRVAQRQTRQVQKKFDKTPVRTMRGRGARQADAEDFWGGKGSKGGGKGGSKGGKGDRSAWSEGGGRAWRESADDWGPPAKRARTDDWGWGGSGSKGSKGGGKGKGGGKSWHDDWREERRDDGYSGYGYGGGGGKGYGGKGYDEAWGASSWRPQRPEPMLQWDRSPPMAPVQRIAGPPLRTREEPRERPRAEREPPRRQERERPERVERVEKTAERSVRKTIRVCNVPKNLEERDIQEAFEDIGRVTKCEVERGVAMITFANSSHAKKAEQTFDRGELNGQTIYVSLHE